MPQTRRTPRTLEQVLSAYPPDVQTLARQARDFVRALLPDVEEMIDGSAPVIGYGRGASYKDMICALSISRTAVKLAVAGGAALPDPHGLLEGAGKVHRHIVLQSAADLRRPGVEALVRAAARAQQARSRDR